MKFPSLLTEARLIKRYKRFMADFLTDDGQIITAHCANSGRLLGVLQEGNRVWYSTSSNEKRRFPSTWEIVESEGTLVGVNTQHPNKLVKEALEQKTINPCSAYTHIYPESKWKDSRFDFKLQEDNLPDCYIEVKNVHYKIGQGAYFPDAVTTRGLKHLEHLIDLVYQGNRAMMIYIVQRNDCSFIGFAKNIDPLYAQICQKALDAGVEFYGYRCHLSLDEIVLGQAMPIVF